MTITTEDAEQLATVHDWTAEDEQTSMGLRAGAKMTAAALRSLAAERDALRAERDDLAKRLKDAERERNHQRGRADRNAKLHAVEQKKREQLQAENARLREVLRPFIYTGNIEQGYRIGQNPPPPTASEEDAFVHYGGNEFHFRQWLQWRAVKIGRELLGEEE